MAETDITLSIDLDVKDAEKTAKHLQKEIKNIFESRNGQSSPRLTSLQVQMKKTVQEADKLQKKLTALKDQKVPTKEYAELSKQMYKLEAEASGLTRKMKEFEKSGGNTVSQKYQEWERRIEQIGIETSKVINKMEHLESTNMAYRQGYQTEEYIETERKLDAVNDKLKQQIIQYREIEDKEENAGKKGESAFSRIKSAVSDCVSALKLMGGIITKLGGAVFNLGKKFYTTVFQKLILGIKSIINGIKKIAVSASKLFNKFNIFSKGNNSPVKQLLRNILRYGLGISSIMVLFNKLRNNITGNLKDIIAKSGEAKTAYDNLKLSIGQLSHQVSAIFEPVLKSLEPLLTMIIERLNQAALAVTKFIGAITGQSKILKARKNLNALADSAGEASKQLSGLDNLNVLSSDKGGGAGAGDADWYDWEDIDPKYLDFWQRIKDEWEKDVPDFTWLGKMLADRITLALSNIDWAKVFKNAMKLGVSLATFLNGFFDEDMLKALGETIANAINTAIYFAWSFLEAFDFGKFGTNIAQGFVNLINGIDWEALVEAIQMGFDGVLLAVRNFVNKIIDPEEGIDFERLRKNLETAIINTFNSLTSFVQNLHWNTLKDRIIEFFSFDVVSVAQSISNFINELSQQDVVKNFTDIILSILGSSTKSSGDFFLDEDGNPVFMSGMEKLGKPHKNTGLAGFFDELIKNTDINTIISDVSTAIVTIIHRIAENIQGIISRITDKDTGIDPQVLGSAIHDVLWACLDLAESLFTNEEFQEWFDELLSNIKLDELATKLGNIIYEALYMIEDIIPWEQLRPIIVRILTDMFGIGAEIIWGIISESAISDNIIGGLSRGLLAAAATILLGPVGTIAFIVLEIIKFFKKLFKIESPSKVFEEIGTFIIEGLALGLKNTIQQVLDKLTELKDKMLTKATEIKDKTVEKWTTMKDTLIGVIDALKEGIKTPINGIIGFFEGMVNSAIDGINLLAGKINAVGDLGVFDFVPNIPELGYVQLPRLAQGAVIPPNREFLAMLGDQKSGVNIETPLDTMKEAFLEALSQAGIGGNGTQQIVLQLDGKTFMTAMVNQNNEYKKMHGGQSAYA